MWFYLAVNNEICCQSFKKYLFSIIYANNYYNIIGSNVNTYIWKESKNFVKYKKLNYSCV